MAEPTSVALAAASIPNPAGIARAEKFVRERFLHDGEDPAIALAAGTPRRRALDQALAELSEQAKHPSTAWRREFSLLLGLERVLSEDEPKLADGTVLSAHQVDALSGTLTALLAEAMRSSENGNGRAMASPELLASAAILGPDDLALGEERSAEQDGDSSAVLELSGDQDDDPDEDDPEDEPEDEDDEDDDDLGPVQRAAPEEDEDEDDELEDELDPIAEEEEQEPELQSDSDEEPRDWVEEGDDEESLAEQPEDPNAAKRFWFEHATGAGKTVAALGFVEASQTGGVLILTHRRNLVDQFNGELRQRGYSKRISKPLLKGEDSPKVAGGGGWGPVTVETYQWFVRNAGKISSAYTIVICDEAHTALGEKTSGAIRNWTGPIFIGMTATGALIARHVTDLFPTQTSRFDLAQAARRGVIAPLRCLRISPGVGVRTIAK
ncbi:MAG TPA: DEAD/DEAH box helicase family protein, partial [Solirubrobacteraceae bacterium]